MLSKILLINFASLALLVEAVPSLTLRTAGPEAVDSVDSLQVVTTLTNNGDETLKVLKDPRTVLSEMQTNIFDITHQSGARPSFTGVQVKYSPNLAGAKGAYTLLNPGQSVAIKHNLGQAYNFTQSKEGQYNISPKNVFYVLDSDSSVSSIEAQSVSHSTKVSGKLAITSKASVKKRALFNGCTGDQQAAINEAIPNAQSYARNAALYLASELNPTARYTTWFGEYALYRKGIVASHFDLISANIFATFTYDCDCQMAGVFAYVYVDELGVIHLCDAFWDAPVTGTDSKAGTIVHEASHFTVNGGTRDYSYGQPMTETLAVTDPDEAVMNADSHEYFAENNPQML